MFRPTGCHRHLIVVIIEYAFQTQVIDGINKGAISKIGSLLDQIIPLVALTHHAQ